MSRQLVTDYLENFRSLGAAPAYAYPRGYRTARWSYLEVAQVAAQFARELERRGVAKGERVVLGGANTAEWVAAFFGCMLRGAVAVPMDRIAAPDFVRRVAEQVDAKLIVASRELLPVWTSAPAGQGNRATPVIALDSLRDEVAHHSPEPYRAQNISRTDPVEIVFTSGATADPKGVVITHANILANLAPFEPEIARYRKYERLFHPIRFLNLLPLSHVFGQFLGIFIPQLIGGTVLFEETLNPGELISTVKRERVSVIVTVPRLLQSLREKLLRDAEAAGSGAQLRHHLESSRDEKFLWRWWRFRRVHRQFGWKFWTFISGGAALDAETEEFWRRLGYVVVQGYGLTETTSIISVEHPFRKGPRSIGKVLPGREMKLDSATGEILVRGESIAGQYWQGRELKPVAGEEGWFRTGDLGEVDAGGNLHFKGRRKNVIVNPAGLNIYPEDLEAALKRDPAVRDAVVVPSHGVSGELGGNAEPAAALLLRDPAADAAAIVARANQQLADFQHIRHWIIWPEEDFPRTATEKPRTHMIQQVLAERLGGAAAASSGASSGTLAEIIARITRRAVPQLAPTLKLDALGLSSIDRVELMSALEDRYQVELDESVFAAATTVADVEQMLHAAVVPQAASGISDDVARPPSVGSRVDAGDSGSPARPTLARWGEDSPAKPSPATPHYHYPRWAQRWPVPWVRTFIYYLLTYPYTMLMARPRVRGVERLRGVRGPLLIVSNHITEIDIGFIQAALPTRYRTRLAVAMRGEGLREMRHPARSRGSWLRRRRDQLDYWLITALFNVFPLPQRSGFRRSFAFAGESVDRGYSVVIFPEGARTETGELMPFRNGAGLLAQRLGLPVLPVRIDGLFPLKLAKKHYARPGTVTVTLGEPIRFAPETPPEEIAERLHHAVASLS